MKVKQITIEHTFQIRQYEPLKVSMTADIEENDNVFEVSKVLQKMAISIALKHSPTMRDQLIAQLVDCANAPQAKPATPPTNGIPKTPPSKPIEF